MGLAAEVTARLIQKSDGHFRYTGGVFGGTSASMGPTAVLQCGSIQLLVMSYPTYDWPANNMNRSASPHGLPSSWRKEYDELRHGYPRHYEGVLCS